jgi:hypothetical protein
MRLRLCPVILSALVSTSCGGPTSPSASPPPPATTPAPTPTPNPGPTSNCNSIQTVAPPAVGGTFASGTQTTFRQGGTYQLPAGTLRLTGTGAGRVILTVAQGSTRSNAPFDLRFTGPGTMDFEPFQAAPESVTMTLCTP